MTTENIDIRVREDGARVVRRNLADIGDQADRTSTQIDRLQSVLSIVGRFLAVREVMKWADAWSAATSSIKIATSSMADAIDVQDKLFKAAQRSRQEFGSMAELYAAVARQSEPLKKSQAELLSYTENIAKALAIQHTSMQAARGPLLQLGQAMGSGTIRAQEFNSIMLGLPYVMKIVAENFKGTGVSVMQLRQIMLAGKLESKDFFEAFQRGSEQINKDFSKTQVTFGQAITIFKNELIKFTGTMDSTTGASAKFASGLKLVADNLTLIAGAIAALAIGKFLTPLIERIVFMRNESALLVESQRAVAAQAAASMAVEAEQAAASIRSAEAVKLKTLAEVENARVMQTSIVLARESALTQLAKANADAAAAAATAKAAAAAGALSYALAVKKEAELALAAAEARRSASLTELAVLGQQQARVTVIQTEATVAHTAAVRALAAAQGVGTEVAMAHAASQGAVAVSAGAAGAAAGAAGIASRALGGVLALFGGWAGVAITALAGVAMWLANLKGKADDAKKALDAVRRIDEANKNGGSARESDLEAIQRQLNDARKNLEAVEDRAANVAKNDTAQRRYAETLANARAEVEKYTSALETGKNISEKTGGAIGQQMRALSEARTQWEATSGAVKTATTVQEKYDEKLKKSQEAHKSYIELLKKNNPEGVNDKEIARANALQNESEMQMFKNKEQELKTLRNKGKAERVAAVKLEADETRSIIGAKMQDQLRVLQTSYDAQKNLLDLRHRNGLISEGSYLAQNLALVSRNEEDQKQVLVSSLEAYVQAYAKREKVIRDSLKGQAESDALKKLSGDYEKFVSDVNSSLEKLSTKSAERLSEVLVRLEGSYVRSKKAADKYWDRADNVVNKDLAMAQAKQNLVYATEQEAAAYEAVVRVSAQHEQQIERQTEAYEAARKEADDFRQAIDWQTAGADTLRILQELTAQADKMGVSLEEAYKRLETLKQKAAEAAVLEVRNKEYNKNIQALSDSIATSIFEGGKEGGHKLRDWLKNYFLRNPITVMLNGLLNSVMGGSGGILGGLTGEGGSGGGIGAIANLVSMAKNIYSVISGGFSSLAANISGYVQSGINFLSGSGGLISQGPVQVGGLASGVGSAAGMFAGAYGGIMGGRLISNGYSLTGGSGNGTVNTGTAAGALIGSIVPGIGTAIGALVGGLLGGAVNRLFGRKLTESGIEGTFGGETGFQGNRYEFHKGGLFRSNKTTTSALDEDTRSNFANTYFTLKQSITDMATTLGLGTDALKNFTASFKVNLKDLSAEDAQKKIEEEFQKIGIAMSDLVLGTTEYSRAGETSLDTLLRLGQSLQAVNSVFENMGHTLLQTSLAGGDIASKLVDTFGGIDNFISQTSAYFENFYTEGEKYIALQKQMQESFKKLNIEMPTTNDEYRKLVDSQDLTTESGRNTYAALIQLSSLFNTMTKESERLAQAERDRLDDIANRKGDVENKILRLQGNDRQALDNERKKEYDALWKINPELAERTAFMWSLEDAEAARAEAARQREEEERKAEDLRNRQHDVEVRILQLLGKDSEALALQRKKEYDALWKINPALADRTAYMWSLEDAENARTEAAARRAEEDRKAEEAREALRKLTDNAFESLSLAVNKMIDSLNVSLKAAQERVTKLKNVLDLTASAIKAITGSDTGVVTNNYEASRNFIASAAISSSIPDADLLQKAIEGVQGGLTTDRFSTRLQFERAQMEVAAELQQIADRAKDQLSNEERVVESLEQQIEYWQEQLRLYKEQMDIMRGVNVAVKSFDQAFRDWVQVSQREGSSTPPPTTTTPGSTTPSNNQTPAWGGSSPSSSDNNIPASQARYSQVTFLGSSIGYVPITDKDQIARLDRLAPVYHSFDGTGNLLGLLTTFREAGGTMYDLSALSGYWYNDWVKAGQTVDVPAFRDGGMHSGGLRIVGEQGWELEATGAARYWNQNQLSRALTSNDWGQESAKDESETTKVVSSDGRLEKVVYALGRQQIIIASSIESILRKLDKKGIMIREPDTNTESQ